MASLYYLPQYRSTTLSTVGGLDASQTTGITITAIPVDLDINVPGIICVGYADPLVTTTAEYISYTSIDGTNTLVGAVRGAEGYSGKTHSAGETVAWVVSKSHINNINDKLRGVDATLALDSSGNEVIKTASVASAVNEVTIKNAATGNPAIVQATGGDTNVGLNLVPKGSGTVQADGVALVTISSTATLTNKRITKRVGTVADAATITPTADDSDVYTVTALAQAATIAAPSGTPTNGQTLVIRLLDNGTARALTWDAIYAVIGTTLPTTTTLSKYTYVGCMYNTASTKWDVLAVQTQA